MRQDKNRVFRLEDYRPSPFRIPETHLSFELAPDATIVRARLLIERAEETRPDAQLVLDGDELELVEARLREQLERIQHKIKTLEDLRGEYASNASDAWVIDFGLACIGAAEQQLKAKSGDLVAISGQSSSFKDAAE